MTILPLPLLFPKTKSQGQNCHFTTKLAFPHVKTLGPIREWHMSCGSHMSPQNLIHPKYLQNIAKPEIFGARTSPQAIFRKLSRFKEIRLIVLKCRRKSVSDLERALNGQNTGLFGENQFFPNESQTVLGVSQNSWLTLLESFRV